MLLILILSFAFLAGALCALAVSRLLGAERQAVTRRLAALPGLGENTQRSLAEEQLEGSWQERLWMPGLKRLALWGLRLTPAGASARLRGSLARAGHPARLGVGEFAGLRVLSAGLCLLLALPLCLLLPSPMLRLLLIFLSLVIGLSLPETLLEQAIRRRQALIRRALPEVIDLLVVSVEAGMGLDGAMAKVTEKMRGPLADEMAQARQETQIGKTRAQALKDMASRLEMREIKTFVAAVAQADQLGTSIVRVLRAQSVMARAAKIQAVREQAARLPVTLLFPLVFFVFPAVFVVLLGPSLIRLASVLGTMK
ncbi:MAG: type II secretion system F family protein [Janthinobacterium lividum]